LFVIGCFHFSSSLKFLSVNPLMGHSHVSYINKIAEILHDDGHEIIMISPPMSGRVKATYPRNWTVISIPMNGEKTKEAAIEGEDASKLYWKYKSVFDFMKIVESVTNAGVNQCEVTINHPGLLDSLRAVKFDAAFAEPVDFCAFGLFHLLNIKSYAMTLTIPSTDNTFQITGLPPLTSFVPGMNRSFSFDCDHPTLKSISLLSQMTGLFVATQWRKYQGIFEKVDPHFPLMEELINNSSLFVVNSDMITDFPRLTTNKIVEAGGITLVSTDATIDMYWDSILSLRPYSVLLSFGTVAKASLMPQEYKDSIREAFRRFPNVTFIWKYEDKSHEISKGISNIVEAPFVPQKELFKDSRLSAFITHGGAGSMVEFLHAGVPVIVVPLAGEQTRSGPLVERLGSGVKVMRRDLHDPEILSEAIEKVVYDGRYKEAALRVSHRLKDQPFSAKERVLRNMVFMGTHGPLHFLNHHGMTMDLFSFYSLDVYLLLIISPLLLFLSILILIFKVFPFLIRIVGK
ncbi:hypothetical protein PFISCL1PPCAC_15745, partial [Pristionchus fissidentatus]